MTKPFSRLLIAGLLTLSTVAAPVTAQTLQPLDRIAAVVGQGHDLRRPIDTDHACALDMGARSRQPQAGVAEIGQAGGGAVEVHADISRRDPFLDVLRAAGTLAIDSTLLTVVGQP